MIRMLTATVIVAALTVTAGPAPARDAAKPRARLLQDALDCGAITDSAARLACYDKAVAALGKAEAAKDIVVADREQMRETRRSLFGFRLPSLKIFGGGKDDDDSLAKIDTTIASVGRGAEGQLLLTIADGARWVQTDNRGVFGKIAPGDKLTISRGVMGSYFATIPGRPSFKVERRN